VTLSRTDGMRPESYEAAFLQGSTEQYIVVSF
jgi:hypothetical protein